jgi:flagellar motor protein MotB
MNLSSGESDEENEESEGSENEVQEQVEKSAKKRAKFIEGEKIVQEYAQEVDYELFERKFWPRYYYRDAAKGVTPAIAWTEIFSVIKGSNNSADFP